MFLEALEGGMEKLSEFSGDKLNEVKDKIEPFDPSKKIEKKEGTPPYEGEGKPRFDPAKKITKETESKENKESEEGKAIQNKIDGLRREDEVEKELREKYPEEEGYEIISEAYLRDENGNIVKDPVTGEARRIDFVVVKDGKVVDSIEVTSKTADKTGQSAKETRIRENGGNYIRDSNGNLIKIPDNVQTRIERRD